MNRKTNSCPKVLEIILLLFFTLLFFTACSNDSQLEQALRLAGTNRSELEKVLNHYKNDTIKYKAACYLIENMIYHYAVENLKTHTDEGDSESVYDLSHPIVKHDIKNVGFEFLTSHINHIFGNSTKYPGHDRLTFEDFCEYILPYRISHEPVEGWLPAYTTYANELIEKRGFKKDSDSLLCTKVASAVPGPTTIMYTPKLDNKPTSLLKKKKGSCKDYTMLTRYIMQSLHLTVACDFTPNWANRSMGHTWSAFARPNQPAMSFLVGDHSRPFGEHLKGKEPDIPAKIYRNTYGIQQESLFMQKGKEEIPVLFDSPYIKDVSDEYFNAVDINDLPLTIAPPEKKDFVYLMVFDNRNWTPVHWGRIISRKTNFTKMATGCMYIAMYYHHQRFHAATAPFYLNDEGRVVYAQANKKNTEKQITITRKYPDIRMLKYTDRMLKGIFEGSNQSDFQKTSIFHTVETLPEVAYQTIEVNNKNKFRYVRYIGKEWSFANIAELEFYTSQNGEWVKLTGRIIGTEGSYDNSPDKTKDKAFDGDPLTFFDGPDHRRCWVGLDLGKSYEITEIRYLPRNDDNTIRIGDEYELVYWDAQGWRSLGRQIANDHVLYFKDVPSNALFLLHNLTRGIEERVFTYENGRQVWW